MGSQDDRRLTDEDTRLSTSPISAAFI